jgi:hypothetical protein
MSNWSWKAGLLVTAIVGATTYAIAQMGPGMQGPMNGMSEAMQRHHQMMQGQQGMHGPMMEQGTSRCLGSSGTGARGTCDRCDRPPVLVQMGGTCETHPGLWASYAPRRSIQDALVSPKGILTYAWSPWRATRAF